MGQRNMLYTTPMIDLEMDQQGQAHLHPEPCVLYGSIPSFQQPNINTILPALGNRTNFDGHHSPEHHGALSYGMSQYNGVQNHYLAGNVDLSVATASNHYNMFMTPSGTRVFPGPLSHGPHNWPHDQLPFSSNHGTNEVSANSYGRNSGFVDGVKSTFKRENAEGISGNFQCCNASAGSSSSVAPMSAKPLESGGIGVDSMLPQSTNRMIQGNHLGQPFQTTGTPWLNHQFSGGDIGTVSWNQAPAFPYLHGSINGALEPANMGIQGYQVSASNRSSMTYLHHSSIPQGHQNLHHSPLPLSPTMQGARGHNINFHSHVATSSCLLPTNSISHTSTNPFQDGVELGRRFVGPVPPTGLRIYRPHRRGAMLDATPRQSNLPHLRVLPEDGVAILEVSGYHEIGDSVDHHREMRLDIEHMSYEELLALGEHIGSVGTGLSEKIILSHLKRRTFVSSASCLNLEETACADQELNFCVICQANYKDQEKIGVLDCAHEYHVDCIKKWLVVNNVCPICKSSGLTKARKES